MVAELKAPESNAYPDPQLELDKGDDKGKHIIDADPISIVATTKLQREDPEDPEEGGAPLPFKNVGEGFSTAIPCQ